ncbi:Cytochrome c oxidase assembly protein COX20, mitochondrial [Madurella fahalii]|uniref:Cytochrome c oxidase assembly protein COX20, mitochondrial n=1 Tax=Madurella fahalii TaxID=1157608 RepID=A0ABQ0GJF6_9PEZI
MTIIPPPRDQEPAADATRTWLQDAPSQAQTQTQFQSQQQQQQPPAPQPPQPPHHRATITEAVQSIKPSDFLTVHQAPCSRTGLLTGIGAGAVAGALRWIMGLPVPRAANWAVGTGALAAVAQYEYCQFRRRQEREKVRRVVEVYGRQQAAQRAKEEAERKAREEKERARVEEEERQRRSKGWWRFW